MWKKNLFLYFPFVYGYGKEFIWSSWKTLHFHLPGHLVFLFYFNFPVGVWVNCINQALYFISTLWKSLKGKKPSLILPCPRGLDQGFSTSALVIFWAGWLFAVRSCRVHCGVGKQQPWLPPAVVTTRHLSRRYQISLGGQNWPWLKSADLGLLLVLKHSVLCLLVFTTIISY